MAQNNDQLEPTHSSTRFAVKPMMVLQVLREFQNVSGTVFYDPKNLCSNKLKLTFTLDSVNTNQAQRDADFLSLHSWCVFEEHAPNLEIK